MRNLDACETDMWRKTRHLGAPECPRRLASWSAQNNTQMLYMRQSVVLQELVTFIYSPVIHTVKQPLRVAFQNIVTLVSFFTKANWSATSSSN